MNRREALKRTALLFGVAASPATITRALAEMAEIGGSARYLTSSQLKVVAAMAERILPATDTPGAIDAGVPQFIDVFYGLVLSAEDQNKLRTGLGELDRAGYDNLSGEEQDKVILDIAENNAAPGKAWLRQFRGLTFNGYFSSEAAAKSGFVWDPVPREGVACQPLDATNGRAYFE